MTTTMRNAIEQAALEVGRAIAKYEMLTAPAPLASLKAGMIVTGLDGGPHTITSGTSGRKTRKAAKKAAKAPVERVIHPIARGVKKAAGPRDKGVKKAIMNMLGGATEGLTIPVIVSMGGFKETSVRATLMGLKKKGIATTLTDKKSWALYDTPTPAGNSEGEHASA